MTKKDKGIYIKVTLDEREQLQLQAKKVNLTLSQYLRNLGLNYPIYSKTDHIAIDKLGKLSADLGRLGGLFKSWLSDNRDDRRNMLGRYHYTDISDLVDEILKQKEEVLHTTRELISSVRDKK